MVIPVTQVPCLGEALSHYDAFGWGRVPGWDFDFHMLRWGALPPDR